MARARPQEGLALITVVIVLAALTLIATPFALSMRSLESGALLQQRHLDSEAALEQALDAARRHLAQTHPAWDVDSPHADDMAELSGAGAARRFPEALPKDPHGSLRSVTIQDESGKVSLNTASAALLGNLLGGRTWLDGAVDEFATQLGLNSVEGFPEPGFAWVGGEQVSYTNRSERGLEQVQRAAASANLERGTARAHDAGTEVLDGRLMLLVQRAWHAREGVWQPAARVDALRDIARFSELSYSAEELERVRSRLSVHAGPIRWEQPQRVLGVEQGRWGRSELVVRDGLHLGPGSVLQLEWEDGGLSWNLVLSAVRWGSAWRLGLLENLTGSFSGSGSAQAFVSSATRHGGSVLALSVLQRQPVNLGSASQQVLAALFAGVGTASVTDVITEEEAAELAVFLLQQGVEPDSAEFQRAAERELDTGRFSAADVDVATRAWSQDGFRVGQLTALEAAGRVLGLESLRPLRRVSQLAAQRLAQRVLNRRPQSHEDFAELTRQAVEAGELDESQRVALLRNALDAGDARIEGGTAPFTYASAGVFQVSAAASENLPNGRERSRSYAQQVLSVAPPGDTARLFASQQDFELSMDFGWGWASRPSLMAQGTPADAGEPAGVRPGRDGVLIAGAAGPSLVQSESFVAPATVRSALLDTHHFDEGELGRTGHSPEGFDLAQGPLRWPVVDVKAPLLGTRSDLLQPFGVEFWFQMEDVEAEAMLFDAGVDVLENRVWIMLREGVLSLRVSDGGITDFEAQMEEGQPPPAGEIRYAFDDGLELLPDVPYHVAALVGGSHDNRLALFVDGVPRGRRVFTTHLTEGMASVGALPATGTSTARSERIAVESTAGFPARGVLRVGWELLEYADKTEDSFILKPDSSRDPFGGRSRRGTVGGEHELGETVELMGYSRTLGATVAPQGDGTLASRMAEWAVAELDPNGLSESIEAGVTVTASVGDATETLPIELGTGLLFDATSIPVRSIQGGSLDGVFQATGGHALLFCDYGNTELAGQDYPILGTLVTPTLPGTVLDNGNFGNGSWLGGGEVVMYDSFNGSALLNCRRAREGIPVGVPSSFVSPLDGQTSPAYVNLTEQRWDDDRAFVTTFDSSLRGVLPSLPEEARVLVIPLSVDVEGGNLADQFHPFPEGPPAGISPLVQLGLDFPDPDGGTEWVRWTTPTADFLVRDDLQAVEDMLSTVTGTSTWVMDTPLDQAFVDGLNERLRFRAQGGTEDSVHEPVVGVLPVHVFGAWGVEQFEPLLGIPGRHDGVTLMGDDEEKEWHTVNHAVTNDVEWGAGAALVAFREAVVGDFGRTPQTTDSGEADASVVDDRDLERSLKAEGAGARLVAEMSLSSRAAVRSAIRHLNVDSRRLTRIVKAPSGELPDALIEQLHFGEHAPAGLAGRALAQGVRLDELRVWAQSAASELVPPIARYRLADDLDYEQDAVAALSVQSLLYPHTRIRDDRLGEDKLEVLSELPSTGGLLLVDEEIIGYAGLDPVQTGAVFLTARGLYGTRRAKHVAGVAVTPLDFWPVAPLTERADADSPWLSVAEPSVFPEAGGLVWVDDELLEYERVTAEGLAVDRGRFGTTPSTHAAGSLVRWMPARVSDRSLDEVQALELPVHAPGAFFTDLAVRAQIPNELVALDGRVVIDGHASRLDEPTQSPDLFELPAAEPGLDLRQVALGRQGDLLQLWLSARWLPGAFDGRDFASNAWKLGPRLDEVVVKHIQPTQVYEHEQWR